MESQERKAACPAVGSKIKIGPKQTDSTVVGCTFYNMGKECVVIASTLLEFLMYDLTSIKISRSRRPDFLLDGRFFVGTVQMKGTNGRRNVIQWTYWLLVYQQQPH